MISIFLFGLVGGLFSAYLALPYGWLAAFAAYAVGGAACALIPGVIEWRREVIRERNARSARHHAALESLAVPGDAREDEVVRR
ncbi:hypothetical protein [Microvirga antarctica]|uniref:hypothetical protein n=1 Tax=Microvirga antarctica TaxID=2819233 RepID=UPI001B309B3E|nr:hypothetical protein [Microvirga antarctica]